MFKTFYFVPWNINKRVPIYFSKKYWQPFCRGWGMHSIWTSRGTAMMSCVALQTKRSPSSCVSAPASWRPCFWAAGTNNPQRTFRSARRMACCLRWVCSCLKANPQRRTGCAPFSTACSPRHMEKREVESSKKSLSRYGTIFCTYSQIVYIWFYLGA